MSVVTILAKARTTIRRTCRDLLAALILVALGVSAGAAQTEAVTAVALTVSDLEAAKHFYVDVLDFTPELEYEVAGEPWETLYGVFGLRLRVARLRLGDEHIELMQFLAPGGRPFPADTVSNDRWFQHVAIVVADMDAAYARLRAHAVRHASSGPQRLPDSNPDAGGIEAFYFRDPDGHYLEILRFPPGKGASRWQIAGGRLFLGIDHTAIVVADTTAALAFYRGTLGLAITGASENYGSEQAHLNNVFGAHLLITSLRAARGPGVEFLHYLTPTDGRAAPRDTRATDLWHWQTVMQVDDLASLDRTLSGHGYRAVSSALVTLPEATAGYRRARLYRDDDGHAVMLTQTGADAP